MEIMLRQFKRLFEIGLIGHRPLWIGRIAQIKRAQAGQRILRLYHQAQAIKPFSWVGGEIMRLGAAATAALA